MTRQEPKIDPELSSWSASPHTLLPRGADDGSFGVPPSEMSRARRAHRLGGRAAGCPGDVAAEPADRGRHLPVVALPHPPVVGARARHGLQRRLPPHARAEQAPPGTGRSRQGGLDRDLGRHRPDARPGDGRWGSHVVAGPAARARPQRLPRGVLLHVLLQPDHRRVRWGRRGLLRRDRDDRAGHRGAPARDPRRPRRPHGLGEPRGGPAHRRHRARHQPGRPSRRARRRRPARAGPPPPRGRPRGPGSRGLGRHPRTPGRPRPPGRQHRAGGARPGGRGRRRRRHERLARVPPRRVRDAGARPRRGGHRAR